MKIKTCFLGGIPALFGLAFTTLAQPASPAATLQDLKSFGVVATVLHVAAHPDDENTQLITYLARGRGYRTAYLSVTRGDGGQNILGPDLDEKLGVARTQELLAARRLDGGRQFFTRAIDFGYSKSPDETLRIWGREEMISDVVRIIRTFRPDVIVTRFSTNTQAGQHGQHTSSAIMAVEAFKRAGDPNAFPEQLKDLKPWQPRRIVQSAGFGRGGGGGNGGMRMDIGGMDPVLGESFSSISGRSRAMHKTQGFGNGGRGGGGGPQMEPFVLQAGEPSADDLMAGVDTTWGRFPGGAEIGQLAEEAIAKFDTNNPSASIPALLAIRGKLAALAPGDPVVDDKRQQLDGILQTCLGLTVETVVPQAEAVPGEPLKLRHTVKSEVPLRWLEVRYPGGGETLAVAADVHEKQAMTRETTRTLPAGTPLTQPYWLRGDREIGRFRVDDPTLIGRPESPPTFPVEMVFEVGGQKLVVTDVPVQVAKNEKGETRRRIDAIAPVSLKFVPEVGIFAPGGQHPVEVELTGWRNGVSGTLKLELPPGWKATPDSQPFQLENAGTVRKSFTVTAPGKAETGRITAAVQVDGKTYNNQHEEIRYDHFPVQVLQSPARLKVVSLELATRGHRIGYLEGAGDSVAECLKEMGYEVTPLTDAITAEGLKKFDAVVVGIRGLDTRPNINAELPALFTYVEGGGNVIVQYNRNRGLTAGAGVPFNVRISNERVTDENAAMVLLAPDHPALNTPNKITAADFAGWVQERGTYFPNQWDAKLTPLVECADPGEAPKQGSLLVAQYGQGWFVYSGLGWFRQLPEGVPGAYRLFANLVSLGK